MDLVLQKSDHFKRFNVDKYLTAWAVAVHSEYWGRGICTELIKAKIDMLKFLNLELTSTGYSADGSIRASEKAGFKCVYEIRYDWDKYCFDRLKTKRCSRYSDFEKIFEGITYPGIKCDFLKQMYYKLDEISCTPN